MQFLPLFHKLQGRLVLVIGGGEVALRKARLLSDAGAVLRVVAPEIRSELQELAASIRERGVIQPLLLRPHPDNQGEYQIVAGERA